MTRPVIQLENVSKYYRLGYIGGKTLREDIQAWWARVRGKENPLLKVGHSENGEGNQDYIWALKDINLTINQGDILGVIGANGAGKSTLLKILSRITAPTLGTVKIKGRVGSLLEIGTGFHPELTGRENVYLNGAILGMRRVEVDGKLEEIVDFSGVRKYIDTPVKRYSSGMRVRLGFAVAAHLDPEILVVDEVLAVGDAAFQKKCLGKMGAIANEGRTILFVSHNMGSIQDLTDQCLVLEKGKIAFLGETYKAIEYYLKDEDNSKEKESRGILAENDLLKILTARVKRGGDGPIMNVPLFIDIDVQAVEDLTDLTFMLSINNSKNARLITTREVLSLIPKGNHTLEIQLDHHHLAPGNYSLWFVIESNRLGRMKVSKGCNFILDELYVEDSYVVKHKDKVGTLIPMRYKVKEESEIK
jgi:lipopolysaccharide transport system ATP-binding protein